MSEFQDEVRYLERLDITPEREPVPAYIVRAHQEMGDEEYLTFLDKCGLTGLDLGPRPTV